MSLITTGLLKLLGKESTEQKQENIRSYVYILREDVFFMTGTGTWHTHALWTLLKMSIFFPSSQKLFSRVGSPKLIPGSPLCFEKSMNIFMNLFRNTEKVSKIYLQSLVISFKNHAFTGIEIIFMLLICSLRLYYDYLLFMLLMCFLRCSYDSCLYFDSDYPFGDFLEESKFNDLSEFLSSHCQEKTR